MSNRTDIVVETDNAEGQVLLSASRVYDLTEDKTQDTINSEVGSSLTSLGNTLNQLKTDTCGSINLTGTNTTGAPITEGTFFYNDGVLVRATTTILDTAPITTSNTERVTAGGLNELNNKIVNIGLSETGIASITMSQLSFTQKGSMYVASVSLPDETLNIPTGVKIAQVCRYGGGIGTIPFVQTDNDGSNLNVLAIDNPGSSSSHYIVVRWYK